MSETALVLQKGNQIIEDLGPFRHDPCELGLAREPTFEEWCAEYRTLRTIEHHIPWWIGDLLIIGETRWPEMFAQALGDELSLTNQNVADATGRSYWTISQWKWMANAIPPAARRPELSHSHHRAVAKLPAEARDQMLETAVQEGWSRRDLEAAVRKETGGVTLLPQVCLRCETRLEYDLARRGKCGGCGLQFTELMEIAAALFMAVSSGVGKSEAIARAKGRHNANAR